MRAYSGRWSAWPDVEVIGASRLYRRETFPPPPSECIDDDAYLREELALPPRIEPPGAAGANAPCLVVNRARASDAAPPILSFAKDPRAMRLPPHPSAPERKFEYALAPPPSAFIRS